MDTEHAASHAAQWTQKKRANGGGEHRTSWTRAGHRRFRDNDILRYRRKEMEDREKNKRPRGWLGRRRVIERQAISF